VPPRRSPITPIGRLVIYTNAAMQQAVRSGIADFWSSNGYDTSIEVVPDVMTVGADYIRSFVKTDIAAQTQTGTKYFLLVGDAVDYDEFHLIPGVYVPRPGSPLVEPERSYTLRVRTGAGEILPVSSVVHSEYRRSPTDIERVDGQRVTYITANLQSGAALGDIVEELRADLRDFAMPKGFSIVFSGEYEEQQKAQTDFLISILMALVLIYMVMAAQFERFLDPLIVMISVPLAIVGVVPILLLTGTTLNIQSLMGVVMLIGIVVNNAIVLVDYINLLRREQNMSIQEAVMESGRRRLRPILMTTCTTVLGMLPLSFGMGAGGEIQAALARSVIGGLTVSTLITLVLIPSAYISIHNLLDRKWRFQIAKSRA